MTNDSINYITGAVSFRQTYEIYDAISYGLRYIVYVSPVAHIVVAYWDIFNISITTRRFVSMDRLPLSGVEP